MGRKERASEQLSKQQMRQRYGPAARLVMIYEGQCAPAFSGYEYHANGGGHGLGASAQPPADATGQTGA